MALLLGGVAFSASPVSAANTLHVMSCADSGANTLRDALALAAAGNTIVFDQNCTITLTTGTLTLPQNVTIDGTGHTVIVDGGCTFSSGFCQSGGVTVFGVNSGVTASLSHLTIQHGAGTFVCLISVGVSFTCGGAIANEGALTVTNCTLAGNSNGTGFGGGAIYNGGTMTMMNSTISGNYSGANGSGIFNAFSGTLAVTNSTITGNTADSNGGGIYTKGMVTVTNSTVSSNTAGTGGGMYDGGNYNVTLTNTIVAGNTASTGSDLDRDNTKGGLFVSGGHNLIGKINFGGFSSAKFDQFGTSALPLDPLLGTLGANGGPTRTMPLLTGSPAIATADPAICANTSGTAPVAGKDQRGLARPTALCAIGASEPLISAIRPAFGPPGGSTTVTLTGAGAVPGVTVSLGGVNCTNIQIINSTTLTCTSGAHVAGTVDVVLTAGSLNETAVGGYTYGVANPLPGAKVQGGIPAVPPALPGARPVGSTGGIPNPLPNARP